MKRFCLFLVFVNIVYFFWGVTAQQPKKLSEGMAVLSELKGLESLGLLGAESLLAMGEDEKLAEPRGIEVVIKPKPLPVMSCYMIKGLVSQADADQLLAKLIERELEASVIRELVREEFWLIHSQANNWDESLKHVKVLKAKGISDLWLVPSGEDKGVISLGLFATKKGAEKSLKKLQGKQIKSTIRLRQKFRYGIKLKWLGDIVQLSLFLNEVESGMNNSVNKINC